MPDCSLIHLPLGADITCVGRACIPFSSRKKSQSHDRPPNRFDTVAAQIAPFNKKGIALTESTSFAGDLEWDSLTVMDFVAAIEDEFDIIITMNMQAEIETVGQLVDAVQKLRG
jgi:acyl carrier protein